MGRWRAGAAPAIAELEDRADLGDVDAARPWVRRSQTACSWVVRPMRDDARDGFGHRASIASTAAPRSSSGSAARTRSSRRLAFTNSGKPNPVIAITARR